MDGSPLTGVKRPSGRKFCLRQTPNYTVPDRSREEESIKEFLFNFSFRHSDSKQASGFETGEFASHEYFLGLTWIAILRGLGGRPHLVVDAAHFQVFYNRKSRTPGNLREVKEAGHVG
jgi:hypothetical protein